MTDEERFYWERDRRTREAGVIHGFELPVRVVVGRDAAHSVSGQMALLALVNMLSRIHRHLQLEIPPAELLTPAPIAATRLDEAAKLLCLAINPYIRLDAVTTAVPAIGLGAEAPAGLPWYAGTNRQIAIIDQSPAAFEPGDSLSLGAALAACMASAALLRQVLGYDQRPAQVSAWNLREGSEADPGPNLPGPLDVGSVLQIGAGGVGSCLAYWLSLFGTSGDWRVLDRDMVLLHNTNRSLGLFALHAGWPSGSPQNKALAAAKLFGASAHPVWYDEFDHDAFKPDLVLPLANERGVRHSVAARGEPLILHATTSRTWEAQLHRHLPHRDDCITCRMPDPSSHVQLSCATVPLEHAGQQSSDAALPFLSATAALLLVGALYRLQLGQLAVGDHNLSAVCFRDVRRHARLAIHTCRKGCTSTLPPHVRRRIHAGHRWSHLDISSQK